MNYFNSLPLRRQLEQLGHCRLMAAEEFAAGCEPLKGRRIVILGCGYALREEAITQRRASWQQATEHDFKVGTFKQMLPTADLVLNLTPDKQHSAVLEQALPLIREGACLSYSHGFNIVEEGQQVRPDLTVIMVAPKCPGTEVREEYLRGFGVPTLIAVHPENDPRQEGLKLASAYAAGIGSHRAGVLESSFVAEVKSDLMGEQTILCGMLQSGSLLCFDRMVGLGLEPGYASRLVQYGWETLTEALKLGGITHMMDRLANPAKLRAFRLAEELKKILLPLFRQRMDEIFSGQFSTTMMQDWADDDRQLLTWRQETAETAFEQTPAGAAAIPEQEYFDHGIVMVAMIKAGVELAYEIMVHSGMKPESAYYESLHETPLIANTIARRKLYEMNRVISDTAEYGCYLFSHACIPLLEEFMSRITPGDLGTGLDADTRDGVDNLELIEVNERIRNHPVEVTGKRLRAYMSNMKPLH